MPRPKNTVKMHTLGARIPEDDYNALVKIARDKSTLPTYLVRGIIKDYLVVENNIK